MLTAIGAVAGRLRRPLRGARALARDERGVTAIEVGILGVPFFVLIAAIMESALIFFASQVLDGAVQDASRHILTGEDQSTAGFDIGTFKDDVCGELYGLFDCGDLKAKVSLVSDFAAAQPSPVLKADGSFDIDETWSPGKGGEVVMVQVYYKWPTLFNFAGFNMANTPDGKARLLSAVRVFMNEPFT